MLFALLLMANHSYSQTTFQYHYDESPDEAAFGLINTFDGGYATIGFSSFLPSGTDVVLAKYNSAGQASWQTRLSGPGVFTEQGTSLIQLQDSGYAGIAITFSYNSNDGDILIFRTDKNGNLMWNRVYDGGVWYDYAYGICEALDGGLAFTGLVSTSGGGTDAFVAKVDQNGNHLWSRYVGGSGLEAGYDIIATADSGFVVGGSTSSFGPGNPSAAIANYYLFKVDKNGTLVYTQAFGRSTHSEIILDLYPTRSGGVAFCGSALGTSNSAIAGTATSTGTILWTTEFTGDSNEEARSISETWDGGYVLAGSSTSTEFNDNSNQGQAYLIRLDATGSMRWAFSYGETNNGENAIAVVEAPDSGYTLAGFHFDFTASNMHVMILKTDTAGRTTCNDIHAGPAAASLSLTGVSGGTSTTGTSGAAVVLSTLPTNWTRIDLCTILSEESIQLAAISDPERAGIFLDWNTADQTQYEAYRIERSQDGQDFEAVTELTKGTDFTDPSPYPGSSYYRVIGLDLEGEESFSNTVEVLHTSPREAKVTSWPNPFHGELSVGYELENTGEVELQLINLAGKTIRQEMTQGLTGWNTTSLPTQQLAQGMYLLQVKEVTTGRLIGQKKVIRTSGE